MYGVLERQFGNYYDEAAAQAGRHRREPAEAARVPAGQRRVPHGLRRHARRGAPAREPQGASRSTSKSVTIASYQVQGGRHGADPREVAQAAAHPARARRSPQQVGLPEWVEVNDKEIPRRVQVGAGAGRHPARHQREPRRRVVFEVIMILEGLARIERAVVFAPVFRQGARNAGFRRRVLEAARRQGAARCAAPGARRHRAVRAGLRPHARQRAAPRAAVVHARQRRSPKSRSTACCTSTPASRACRKTWSTSC